MSHCRQTFHNVIKDDTNVTSGFLRHGVFTGLPGPLFTRVDSAAGLKVNLWSRDGPRAGLQSMLSCGSDKNNEYF